LQFSVASDLLELVGSWLSDSSEVFRCCAVHDFSHGIMTWIRYHDDVL
jgi:hypothetical protein